MSSGSESNGVDDFRAYTTQLIEQMQASFPECEATKNALHQYNSLCQVNGFMLSAVREHYNHLMTPLPETVAYIAPLQRLRVRHWESSGQNSSPNRTVTMLDAYYYRDSAVILSSDYRLIQSLKLQEKWNDPDFDDESKAGLFDFLDAINQATFTALGIEPPRMFPAPEIEKEIERYRNEKKGPGLMDGFCACLKLLVEDIQDESGSQGDHSVQIALGQIEEAKPQSMIDEWAAIASDDLVNDICTRQDWGSLVAYFASPECKLTTCKIPFGLVEHASDNLWRRVYQVNVLARLQRKTPPHLLEVIEEKAGALAVHMMNGTLDLGTNEIMEMSNEVVAQCNVEDLQLFSKLISEELQSILSAFNGSSALENLDLSASGMDIGHLQMLSSMFTASK